MINTYSTPMIVVEAVKKIDRGSTTLEILAETTDQQSPSEVPISFYGETADEAARQLIKGARFTYRGIVRMENEKPKLVGLTFMRID